MDYVLLFTYLIAFAASWIVAALSFIAMLLNYETLYWHYWWNCLITLLAPIFATAALSWYAKNVDDSWLS